MSIYTCEFPDGQEVVKRHPCGSQRAKSATAKMCLAHHSAPKADFVLVGA